MENTPERYADEAQEFFLLRRRAYVSWLLPFAIVVPLGVLVAASEMTRSPVQALLAIPVFGVFVYLYIRATTAWIALLRFRCPRCGKSFVFAWFSFNNLPTNRCKHCDLKLGPPLLRPAEPFWEPSRTRGVGD